LSVKEEDIRVVLLNINKEHAEDYSDWIKVGIALHNAKMPWESFEEFSQRSEKYKENECFYVYNFSRTNHWTSRLLSRRFIGG
jgi:hypothetical protein